MPDITKVRTDSWTITIGASESEYETSVTLAGGYDLHTVMSQKTGTDPLAQLIQGRTFDLTFEFEETVAAVLIRALGLGAAGDMLDVGAQLPTATVKLHPADVDAGTQTEDLFLYAVAFGTLERTADGQGPATWKLSAKALRDSNGKFGRVGAAAA